MPARKAPGGPHYPILRKVGGTWVIGLKVETQRALGWKEGETLELRMRGGVVTIRRPKKGAR